MKEQEVNDEVLVCRCEEVNEKEIIEALRLGIKTVDGVKRITRAGMGLCQGKTCRILVERLITKETGVKISELPASSVRPPIRPVRIGIVAGDLNK